MRMIFIVCLTVLCVSDNSLAFRPFVAEIPNGDQVYHPCKNENLWLGVGHQSESGGDALNPFGNDFKSQGKKWTVALCQLDSDGDGISNGEELGDPNCIWQSGSQPERTENITHPGVCDPFDHESCKAKNSFMNCEKGTIETCRTIQKAGTKMIDLRFPETEVPSLETNYFCMTFDLPNDQDYHIKAYDAIKDNLNVLHHILVYGCDPARTKNKPVSTVPGKCYMSGQQQGCNSELIGLWAFGGQGNCFEEDIGFRFGKSSFSRVMVQLHWNNPMLKSGQRDSSGFRLWYQPAKSWVEDMATFWTGQMLIKIPPRTLTTELASSCPGYCTANLWSKPLHVVRAFNHMHYLGRSMKIEVYRGGEMVKALTNETIYRYDNPKMHALQPHYSLRPGDEVKTTCVFNSESSERWTYFGDSTQDEMCFGFLIVYPKQNMIYPTCVGHGPLSTCDYYTKRPIGKCNWHTFSDFNSPTMKPLIEELHKNCNLDGFCRPECHDISRQFINHPCMSGEAEEVVHSMLTRSHEGLQFLGRVNSCRHVVVAPPKEDNCEKKCELKLKERPVCNPEIQVADSLKDTAAAQVQLSVIMVTAIGIIQYIACF